MDKQELQRLSVAHIEKRKAITKLLRGKWDDDRWDDELDEDDIEFLSRELESAGLISFSIEQRQSDMDLWLQVEFYSKALGKTVVYDYDYYGTIANMDIFIDNVLDLDDSINYFDSRIRLESEV